MKKYFLALILLGLSFSGYSQSVCSTNNITTNPVAPTNPQSPQYLNHFDWTTNSSSYAMNSVCNPNGYTINPFQSNQLELLPLSISKDMQPSDGWEIVAYNLGFDQNNIMLNVTPEHTYMMLYNKYTGILRILVKWCRNSNYNGALLTLKFAPGFQTNLLDMANDEKALDIPHIPNPSLSTALKFYNDNNFWAYADFKLNYDPCTCSFSDTSRLFLYSELITYSSVSLSGKINGIITSISDGNGMTNSDGSFWKSANNINDNLMKVHKSITSFASNYQEIYKNLADNGITINAINALGTFLNNNTFMKNGLKAFPYASQAVKFLSALLGGGASGNQPIQLAPLSVNLDVKLLGTISTSDPMHNQTIGLPGSLSNNQLLGITGGQPLYNETLGVFSLINHPVMYYTESTVQRQYGTFLTYDDTHIQSSYSGKYNFVVRNYKMSDEILKYAINPASGLTLQDAEVMLIVEYEKPSVTYSEQYPAPKVINVDTDLANGIDITGTDKGPLVDDANNLFQNAYKPIGFLNFKNNYSFSFLNRVEVLKINSITNSPPFIPSNCCFKLINNIPSGATPKSEFLLPRIKNFKLKLILNLKRLDNPNAQNVLYVTTFPIELKVAPLGYNMSSTSSYITDANSYATQSGYVPQNPTNKVIPITQSELATICSNSNGYKLNRYSNTGRHSDLNNFSNDDMVVYPNPTSDVINIIGHNYQLISIVNLQGELVKKVDSIEKNINDDEIKIDISDLSSGIYFLKYRNLLSQEIKSKKVIVK